MDDTAGSDEAGRSAQREFDRRLEREAEHRRRMRTLWLVVTVATPIVVYVAARLAIPAAIQAYFDLLGRTVGGPAAEPVDPSVAHRLALLFAFGATVVVARTLWGVPQDDPVLGKGRRRRTLDCPGAGAAA